MSPSLQQPHEPHHECDEHADALDESSDELFHAGSLYAGKSLRRGLPPELLDGAPADGCDGAHGSLWDAHDAEL